MFKKVKLGLSLVKYGFRPGTNLLMCILFLIIGLIVEVSTKGTNLIGAFYLLLVAMFVFQMIISMDVSSFVQTSKMKKALQTTVPVVTGTVLYLVIFTFLVVEKTILIKVNPETEEELLANFVLLIVMVFGAMVYTGFCYKFFLTGTIFFCIYVGATMTLVELIIRNGVIKPDFVTTVILGYVLIVLGGLVEYGLASLFYKKDLSKFAFRGIFGKLQ